MTLILLLTACVKTRPTQHGDSTNSWDLGLSKFFQLETLKIVQNSEAFDAISATTLVCGLISSCLFFVMKHFNVARRITMPDGVKKLGKFQFYAFTHDALPGYAFVTDEEAAIQRKLDFEDRTKYQTHCCCCPLPFGLVCPTREEMARRQELRQQRQKPTLKQVLTTLLCMLTTLIGSILLFWLIIYLVYIFDVYI